MVLACRPPTSPNDQQYKDSVIWRVVLRAAQSNKVLFVTSDGDFYRDAKGDELAESLGAEVRDLGRSVTLFRNIESLLDYWGGSDPSLETQELEDVVAEAVTLELTSVLPEYGPFVIGSRVTSELDVYLTEVHDEVFVSAYFEWYLANEEFPDALDPVAAAQVKSSVTVGLDDFEVREVSLDSLKLYALTPHGDPNIATVVFGQAALGLRSEPYRLRRKLSLPSSEADQRGRARIPLDPPGPFLERR